MPDATSPNPDLLREIQEGSIRVRKLSTALSNRIAAFVDWLNELPGKVATTVYADTPGKGEPGYYFALNFSRSGKRWGITWTIAGDHIEPPDATWAPLLEAPVDIKLHAVDSFPQLLEHIVASQKDLTKELASATARFDKFAAEFGINKADFEIDKKEGK